MTSSSCAKSAVDSLKFDIECPICTDVFEVPKQLSCGHAVCEACANKSAQRGPRARAHRSQPAKKPLIVKCPVCRVDTQIPENGLSTNFVLKNVIAQLLEAQKEKEAEEEDNSSTNLNCSACGKFGSSKQMFLCVDCTPAIGLANALCDACRVGNGHGDHPKCFPFNSLADDDFRHGAFGEMAAVSEKCESNLRKTVDVLRAHLDRTTNFATFSSLGGKIFEVGEAPRKADVNKLRKSSQDICRKVDQAFKNVTDMTEKYIEEFLENLSAEKKFDENVIDDGLAANNLPSANGIGPQGESGSVAANQAINANGPTANSNEDGEENDGNDSDASRTSGEVELLSATDEDGEDDDDENDSDDESDSSSSSSNDDDSGDEVLATINGRILAAERFVQNRANYVKERFRMLARTPMMDADGASTSSQQAGPSGGDGRSSRVRSRRNRLHSSDDESSACVPPKSRRSKP